MSAGLAVGVNDGSGRVSESGSAKMQGSTATREWNSHRVARDQIRGLVRQVFMQNVPQPVRQVTFSGAGPEVEIGDICRLVGKALTEEREGCQESLKATAIPLEHKLWLLEGKRCSGNLAPA